MEAIFTRHHICFTEFGVFKFYYYCYFFVISYSVVDHDREHLRKARIIWACNYWLFVISDQQKEILKSLLGLLIITYNWSKTCCLRQRSNTLLYGRIIIINKKKIEGKFLNFYK